MTIYKLSFNETIFYRDEDGYEQTREKIIGYYLNEETAKKHLQLYCNWVHVNREKMTVIPVEVEED